MKANLLFLCLVLGLSGILAQESALAAPKNRLRATVTGLRDSFVLDETVVVHLTTE